jgi:hypothetical protein
MSSKCLSFQAREMPAFAGYPGCWGPIPDILPPHLQHRSHHRVHRFTWPLRFVIVGGLFLFALVHGVRRRDRSPGGTAAAAVRGPRPLALDDADQDGLPDTLEAALAARFAPAVILDPQEANRPASIAWLLSRIGGLGHLGSDRGSFPPEVRAGSADPQDWVTYVHVYPRTDGRINVQYWFFYTYNEGPLFFDHDSDWEHITVEVEPNGVPRGVYFAQHGNNNPGVYRPWSEVRKIGDKTGATIGEHPLVLSARGTHASYADQASLAWFEHASGCAAADRCTDQLWRTWLGGGLVNIGERAAPLGAPEALAYGGRWGSPGRFLRSRSAPPGPLHQHGFSSDGFD